MTFIVNPNLLWFAGVRVGARAYVEPIVGWLVEGDRVVGLVAELREDGSFKPAHELEGFVGYYQATDMVRTPGDGKTIKVHHALPELAGRQDA